jgi:hypothetical protein
MSIIIAVSTVPHAYVGAPAAVSPVVSSTPAMGSMAILPAGAPAAPRAGASCAGLAAVAAPSVLGMPGLMVTPH